MGAPTDPHETLYRATAGKPALVEVPPAKFLVVDGSGSPDDPAFQEAIAALYALAYTAKFALKKAGGSNVKVPPLEGLYATDAAASQFDPDARARLSWTLMLRLPDPVDDTLIEQARPQAAARRELPGLERVRIEHFDEGTCAQVLHIGPYATEGTTIELLHAFIDAGGRGRRGRHHEIYLGDPRRASPERLRTILRQPVT